VIVASRFPLIPVLALQRGQTLFWLSRTCSLSFPSIPYPAFTQIPPNFLVVIVNLVEHFFAQILRANSRYGIFQSLPQKAKFHRYFIMPISLLRAPTDLVIPYDPAHIPHRACVAIHNSCKPAEQKTRQDQLAWRAAMLSSLVPEHSTKKAPPRFNRSIT
jgi:hypothetical protein